MNQGSKLIVAAEQPGEVLGLAGMKHVRFAAMFMVHGLCRALVYKSCNKYFQRRGKEALTSRRQRFTCQTFTNTHSHIPTSHFRALYMLFLGHN